MCDVCRQEDSRLRGLLWSICSFACASVCACVSVCVSVCVRVCVCVCARVLCLCRRSSESVKANFRSLRGGTVALVVQQDGDVARDAVGRRTCASLQALRSRDGVFHNLLRPGSLSSLAWCRLRGRCWRVPLVHELEPGSTWEAVVAAALLQSVLPPLELFGFEFLLHDCLDELVHFFLQRVAVVVLVQFLRRACGGLVGGGGSWSVKSQFRVTVDIFVLRHRLHIGLLLVSRWGVGVLWL